MARRLAGSTVSSVKCPHKATRRLLLVNTSPATNYTAVIVQLARVAQEYIYQLHDSPPRATSTHMLTSLSLFAFQVCKKK
eukprot:1673108-Pleurochrysis_carterae.AAC.2